MIQSAPSDVALWSRGILEKYVEESIFRQIGSSTLIQFFHAARCCYLMQSSLKGKKNKTVNLSQFKIETSK